MFAKIINKNIAIPFCSGEFDWKHCSVTDCVTKTLTYKKVVTPLN